MRPFLTRRAPWFLNTLTYLNRESLFKSARRDPQAHEYAINLFITQLPEPLIMIGSFDDDFVAPNGPILS